MQTNNTKPNNILLSTIKAIEHQIHDEKESKINIYFDFPPNTRSYIISNIKYIL